MRLIDADAALGLLKSLGDRDYRRSKGTIAEAEKMLMHEEYTPTIDAEAVRHGRWVPLNQDDGNGNYYYSCSRCHSTDVFSRQVKVNYCWNCGAKMDEKKVH